MSLLQLDNTLSVDTIYLRNRSGSTYLSHHLVPLLLITHSLVVWEWVVTKPLLLRCALLEWHDLLTRRFHFSLTYWCAVQNQMVICSYSTKAHTLYLWYMQVYFLTLRWPFLTYMAGSSYWGSVTGCILPLPPHVALIEASSKGNLPIVNQILQEGRQDVNACDRVSHMILCVHV